MKGLNFIVFSLLLTALGLAGGWVAARQTSSGHAEEAHTEHGLPGHATHADDAKPMLSPQALKNLGVTWGEVNTQEFYRYHSVPAVVIETLGSTQPLVSPVAGTVQEINASLGGVVQPGDVLLTLVRDPLPRPVLTLTDEIIKPASEEVHVAFGTLRSAARAVEVTRKELDRVKQFTGGDGQLPVVPRKIEIDLRAELLKAEQALENVREKLHLHGLTHEQIAEFEKGHADISINHEGWRRALQHNGLWTKTSEQIYTALPDAAKRAQWNIAAIGELTGAGLATEQLGEWIKNDPHAAAHFLEVAGLLQQGHSLQSVQTLSRQGGLEPIVQIRAPKLANAADWDVAAINLKPTDRVAAGDKVAILRNPRELQFKAEPVGAETAAILFALQKSLPIVAVPLVEETGPQVDALKVSFVGNDEHAGTVAFLQFNNEPLHVVEQGGRKLRTWRIRAGQKYILRVPTEKLEDVFVLPSDAVADDGADKVIFIQNGESFELKKVVVLYQDHETVVLDSKHSELFPGDIVVQSGAFGLGLALKAGRGAIDPHAGHSH